MPAETATGLPRRLDSHRRRGLPGWPRLFVHGRPAREHDHYRREKRVLRL